MSRRSSALFVLALAALVAVAGCGSSARLVSFDPSSACTTDGRQPGAYPDLEALLPTSFEGKPPATVDSGRNCTDGALGSLAAAGIHGVRFAGATWPLGSSQALTLALFEGDGLTPRAMIDFYEQGATSNSKTEKLQSSDVTAGTKAARRLDVLQSDGTAQSIVAWPGAKDGQVVVLLAADLGDTRVTEAVQSFAK